MDADASNAAEAILPLVPLQTACVSVEKTPSPRRVLSPLAVMPADASAEIATCRSLEPSTAIAVRMTGWMRTDPLTPDTSARIEADQTAVAYRVTFTSAERDPATDQCVWAGLIVVAETTAEVSTANGARAA
ncbi:MAG: hypothetical protein PWQ57_3310 [Desulfovibrionales bacterium]|nr:hypothetical protein [Desulfovibrionales bacterium]